MSTKSFLGLKVLCLIGGHALEVHPNYEEQLRELEEFRGGYRYILKKKNITTLVLKGLENL